MLLTDYIHTRTFDHNEYSRTLTENLINDICLVLHIEFKTKILSKNPEINNFTLELKTVTKPLSEIKGVDLPVLEQFNIQIQALSLVLTDINATSISDEIISKDTDMLVSIAEINRILNEINGSDYLFLGVLSDQGIAGLSFDKQGYDVVTG